MSFGQIIKKLRRKADMTQEELAELLAISPQAVSRWETDAAMPDISLLPRLTNIFNVSADELLEINVAKNEEKINEFLKNAKRALHQGDFQKSAEILGEAHRMFPRSYKIMYELANSLLCVYSRQGKKEYNDVISLCKNILDNCTDSTLRYEALDTLALAYYYAGKNEEMLKLSEQMTPFAYSKERFMMWRWGFD
ncbi:MAG: helix-turn-helix transcriptional regulator, partial [Clostridia bacterium]|nr:helix-turn-helix transcriptional regulator [Clostridia bacterium]